MYQSIDDPQDEVAASKRHAKYKGLIWLATLLGLAAISAIIYWTTPKVPTPEKVEDFSRAEQVTYRKAISETQAPMRRARLQDFLTTYPNSDRIPAVKAQLEVIQTFESDQWIVLSDIIYNPRLPKASKIEALDTYSSKWDGALLGGRSEEIKSIRETLAGSIELLALPNRRFNDISSSIAENIPDNELAGGPKATPAPVIIPPTPG